MSWVAVKCYRFMTFILQSDYGGKQERTSTLAGQVALEMD